LDAIAGARRGNHRANHDVRRPKQMTSSPASASTIVSERFRIRHPDAFGGAAR
jgi:hypothetical protein